jgi:cell division protein FtsB
MGKVAKSKKSKKSKKGKIGLAQRLGRGPQFVAMLLVLGILGAMLIQPTRQLLAQRERMDSMLTDLARIEQRNQKLRAQIERWKDPDFVEQQARYEAGLVKPGEIPYRVVLPSEDVLARKRDARKEEAAPPPREPGMFESFLDFIGFI